MVSTIYDGRLGNNMIQYFVSKFFAKKHGIFLNSQPFSHQDNWSKICSDILTNGSQGDEKIIINDNNFIDIFESEIDRDKHYIFHGWFQDKIFFERYENEIKELINIPIQEKNDDEIFVHYRLGDTINDRKMLPIEYYEEYLNNIEFKSGYISSDTINHPNCLRLIEKFNLKPLSNYSPIDTVIFAKDFKKIILSEGSFSWWIGFLNEGGEIFCNKRDRFWHGDLFLDRWNYICWDYLKESIYDNTKLLNYNAIRLC